jgi:Nickel/cobalt transporter regulator
MFNPTNAVYERSQMRIALSLLLAAALTVPTSAFAGNKGQKAHHAPNVQTHSSEAVVALITVTERTIISDYVKQYRDTLVLAPGNAKPLPPGIAKKVAWGGTLPPGIAKRYLPQDLLVQLPPRPGYQWVVVDNDVVLIAVATGLIVDILADIL